MPYYESVYIARPDISAQQVEALTQQFTTIISENGGSVGKTEYWGLRNLAYRIKKSRKGHYVMMNLDAPNAAVAEMERHMRLSEDVIRILTIRVDELEEEPSVVMQSRGSRDHGRGRNEHRGRHDHRDRGDRDRGDRPQRTSEASSDSKTTPSGDK